MVMVLPAPALPVNVGALTLVMLSLLELPLSLAIARSGVEGAVGGVMSMVIFSAAEAAETLPAASIAVAVNACPPPASVAVLNDQLPAGSATTPPSRVTPS